MTESRDGLRVRAYFDGFNFYRGLMSKGWGHYRWLDFGALAQSFLLEDEVLTGVRYFTALVRYDPERMQRQRLYLRALKMHSGVEAVEGVFFMRQVRCEATCREQYKRAAEKQSDVNLATHLIADAFDNEYDVALLCCADGDLIPAVRHVKDRHHKIIRLVDPPHRHSDELADLADDHLHITETAIRSSQLPNPVTYAKGRRTKAIHRPDEWAEP